MMSENNNNGELETLMIGLMKMTRNNHLQTPKNNQRGPKSLPQKTIQMPKLVKK